MNRYSAAALIIAFIAARPASADEVVEERLLVGVHEVMAYRDDALTHLKFGVTSGKLKLSPADQSRIEAYGRSLQIEAGEGDALLVVSEREGRPVWTISEKIYSEWDAKPVQRESVVFEAILTGARRGMDVPVTSDFLSDEMDEILVPHEKWLNFRASARKNALGIRLFLTELKTSGLDVFRSKWEAWKKSVPYIECLKKRKKKSEIQCRKAFENFGEIHSAIEATLKKRIEVLDHLLGESERYHAAYLEQIPYARVSWIPITQPLFSMRSELRMRLDERVNKTSPFRVAESEYEACFKSAAVDAEFIRCLTAWSESLPLKLEAQLEADQTAQRTDIDRFLRLLQTQIETP